MRAIQGTSSNLEMNGPRQAREEQRFDRLGSGVVLTLPSRLSGEGPRSRGAGLTVLELALQRCRRRSAVMSASSNAPCRSSLSLLSSASRWGMRGQQLIGAAEKLGEQDLRANVALLGVGALAPRNHLGPGQ